MGRIIASVIVALWLIYMGIMYTSDAILLLAFGILVFLVLSFADLIIRFFAINCKIEVPISTADVGDSVTVKVKVKNGSVLAISKMRYQLVTKNLMLSDSCKHKVYGETIIPGSNQLTFTMVPEEPGNYEVELRTIYIYNMTGTYYVKKRIKKSAYFQVNPAITGTNVTLMEHTKNFYGESDTYNDLKAGSDPSETFQIREFMAGDKLQRIHWKLSAKMDDLMVKENGDPKSAPVVIFLNYEVPKQKKVDHCEAFLGLAYSISFSLLDSGCYHFVSWYSGTRKDIVRVRICDEESFFFMMSAFLSDSYEKSPEPLQQLYKEKYRGERYLFELYLDSQLKLMKNKQEIRVFTDAKWEEELEGLEIIL